jgi:hypothetical protein
MDAHHFDAFVRSLTLGASRRVLVTSLLGGILAALPGWSPEESAAKKGKKGKKGKKKKKKAGQCKPSQATCGKACCNAGQSCIAGTCLGACQFTVDNDLKTKTLQADCATTATIPVEDGFTLEGDGKTIHMAGPVSGYQSVTVANTAVRAGVLIQNGTGTVKNLAIDQGALECGGAQAHSAIVMAKCEGDIESVDIVVTKDNIQCYRGIDAEVAANNDPINVRGVTITGGHTRAMAISGPTPSDGSSLVSDEIRDCTIGGAFFGMLLNGTKQQVKSNAVNASFGILVGVFPSNVAIDDNTITGLIGATNPAGILFNPDTRGTVSNNAISGFNCGISIQTAPGDVALSGNTFPEPENTSDLCFAT